MTEISLHLLDLLENSARAGAGTVRIFLAEDAERGELVMQVEDDGPGMTADEVSKALDPFFTTVPGKRVGLGLALLRGTVEAAGGSVNLGVLSGKGLVVSATFKINSPDRPPLGDVPGTIEAFLACHPGMNLSLTWNSRPGKVYSAEWRGVSRGGDWVDRLAEFAEKLADGMRRAGFRPDGGGFEVEIETGP